MISPDPPPTTTSVPTTSTTAAPTTTTTPSTTTSSTSTTTTTVHDEIPDPTTTTATITPTSTSQPPYYEYTAAGVGEAGAEKAIVVGEPLPLPAVTFEPGEEVVVTLGSMTLANVRADDDGKVLVALCVPSSAAAGPQVLEAKGLTSGAGVSVPLTLGAASQETPAAAPELPRTGSSTSSLAVVALALLAVGALLTASAARVRRSRRCA